MIQGIKSNLKSVFVFLFVAAMKFGAAMKLIYNPLHQKIIHKTHEFTKHTALSVKNGNGSVTGERDIIHQTIRR